ncbi:MAG: response regulator [Pyrinomonadaceae bacterium]
MSEEPQRIETVLAVDSDEENLCLMKSILGLKGFDVLQAVNGREAVDLAFRWRPELILMDLKLPIVSGFTVVRRIKKHESLRNIPIISFAIVEQTCYRELALAEGCAAFLDKPLDFDELDSLIDQFLPGHSLELTSVLVH